MVLGWGGFLCKTFEGWNFFLQYGWGVLKNLKHQYGKSTWPINWSLTQGIFYFKNFV